MALDVCHCGRSRSSRHHRPFLRHGERQLAPLSRRHRPGHGRSRRAAEADSAIPANIVLSKQAAAGEGHGGGSFMDLFKKRYRRSPILASVPWFLQDLSTYGIGIFTPTILAAALGKE